MPAASSSSQNVPYGADETVFVVIDNSGAPGSVHRQVECTDLDAVISNLITGRRAELVPWLASHMDVNAIDAWGVPRDLRAGLEISAVENMKRIARPPRGGLEAFDWMDDARAQRPEYIASFLEVKTVWHPIGM